MVEFQLLGDIEARSDGQRLDVGHARQRCVLAALLVDVNRAVSADQLIDRVWAGEPPHRANNALAAYVSRLRLLLEQADGTKIVRVSGGYMLSTDALSVDLHRFRRLASEGLATTDPVAAAPLFDEALGLWQGEPFGHLDTPWVNDVRTSLAAEHLSVELDRNDVCLRIGRHAELLVGLSDSLQANPLDERLAGQLMLALYRSGRQADALETYRRVRDRLVEELGVDPSPALQAVHQQILDGDPAYPVANPAVRGVVDTRPRQGSAARYCRPARGAAGDVDRRRRHRARRGSPSRPRRATTTASRTVSGCANWPRSPMVPL